MRGGVRKEVAQRSRMVNEMHEVVLRVSVFRLVGFAGL